MEEDAAEGPADRALENAEAKARSVARRLRSGLVVAADTVVTIDGRSLGKPLDAHEAREMLRALSGAVHGVVTGVAVADAASGRIERGIVETLVRMRRLSEAEIEAYVETGEPIGKAGGYAIQGVGALLVEEVRGCFYNVVGLPLAYLNGLLKRFGVDALAALREKG